MRIVKVRPKLQGNNEFLYWSSLYPFCIFKENFVSKEHTVLFFVDSKIRDYAGPGGSENSRGRVAYCKSTKYHQVMA